VLERIALLEVRRGHGVQVLSLRPPQPLAINSLKSIIKNKLKLRALAGAAPPLVPRLGRLF